MDAQEVGFWNAVAIAEHQVVVAGMQDGLVENAAFLKATVLLLNMMNFQIQLAAHLVDELRR